jgi:hypothetical protein
LLILGASLPIVAGLGLFGIQCFLWLKDGYWTEFPLFVFVPMPPFDYEKALGLAKIVVAFYLFPASVVFTGVGVLLCAAAVVYLKETTEKLSAARQRKNDPKPSARRRATRALQGAAGSGRDPWPTPPQHMLDLALLQRPGMLAERPHGADAADHPIWRERLQRRSEAIGAMRALRR